METIFLTLFWMIAILWAMYYWYWSPNKIKNNTPKVGFDFDFDKHSTSSIESIEHSDNEDTRRRNIQGLKYETKTRWPSKTLIKGRHKSL